jgi:hypothetical protein
MAAALGDDFQYSDAGRSHFWTDAVARENNNICLHALCSFDAFSLPSFPRKRESIFLKIKMDTRFRGNDD